MVGSDAPRKFSNLNFLYRLKIARNNRTWSQSVSNHVGYFNQWFDEICIQNRE